MSKSSNETLFTKATEILNDKLPKGLYAEDFSQQQAKTLIKELLNSFEANYIVEHKDEIRDAIKSHFAGTHDELIIIFKKNLEIIIREKNNPEKKSFNRQVLKFIQHMVEDHEELFSKEEKSEVLKFEETKIENLSKEFELENKKLFKHVLHEAVKRFLELKNEDQLIYLNNSLYVKQGEAKGAERRLNSFPREEFSKIKEKHFNKDIFPYVKKELLKLLSSTLDFTKINNQTFLDNYIEAFQNLIHSLVQPILKDEDEAVIGYFTNFILRDYYDEMMIICAKELTKKVAARDKNAENFLNYYNGEIISLNNRRYIKPIIMSEEGNEYKFFDILSIITRYFIVYNKVKVQEEKIAKAKEAIENLERSKLTLDAKQHEYAQSVSEFERIAHQTLASISRRKEHRFQINKKLLSKEELSIIEKKEALERASAKLEQLINGYASKRAKLEKILTAEEQKAQILQKEIKPLNSNYFEIIEALSKAMTHKLQPIAA